MRTFEVTVTRSGEWWALCASVPGASVHGQTRRLDRAETVAREAIALALDVPDDSFTMAIEVELPEDAGVRIATARTLVEVAAAAQGLAQTVRRDVAMELQEMGLSVRDSGALLGVSPQRISQLVNQGPAASAGADAGPQLVNALRELLDSLEDQAKR